MSDDLRYPIGKVAFKEGGLAAADRVPLIDAMATAPAAMRAAVAGLDDPQLDTPYRPGGWTVRQVVHHVPDSHMNAFIRTKLALTEERPTIKPYDQDLFADLPDTRFPIEVSLRLFESLHERWVPLLRLLDDATWKRTWYHPESQRTFTLDELLQIYAWHGRHHVAHITALRARNGW